MSASDQHSQKTNDSRADSFRHAVLALGERERAFGGMAREAHPSTPTAPATLEWVPLPMTAAPQALGGRRLSQIVYEYESPTPTGQHIAVRLERTSTGGTRREAEFKRAASGPMSGAERANKKRCRATLFPEQQASVRKKDVQRKRRAAAATEAAARQLRRRQLLSRLSWLGGRISRITGLLVCKWSFGVIAVSLGSLSMSRTTCTCPTDGRTRAMVGRTRIAWCEY